MRKIIVAHRGAKSNCYNENTLAAFQNAMNINADMIELDVRVSKDRIFTVYHDESLQLRDIRSLTINDIKTLNEEIPTLEEVLMLTKGKIKLDIELKDNILIDEFLKLLLKYFSTNNFIITSFNLKVIKALKERNSEIEVGLLLDKNNYQDMIEQIIKLKLFKPDIYVLEYELMFLNYYKYLDKPIFLWTINDKTLLKQFIINNDTVAGIITDYPELALNMRDNFTI
jgi:glycerophosphoryl diester phosphodiesterase